MPNFADSALQWPISGSWDSVYLRVAAQAQSASISSIFHPGGLPASSVVAVAANKSRQALVVSNSGSQALLLGFGASVSAGSFSEKIVGHTVVTLKDPVYTGAIHAIWDASGSLSGSRANFTELVS